METKMQKDQELESLKMEIEKLKSQLVEPAIPEEKTPEDKTIPTVILHKWTVPARAFKKRDNRWFVSVAFVILVFILLFAFLQDILPIFVLVALMFLVYLLGTVEPDDVEHQITNKGFYTMDKHYKWIDLKDFVFAKQGDWIKLYVNTKLSFPARLIMLVKEGEDKLIFEKLKTNIPYWEEDNQSWISKITDGQYLPLKEYLPKEDLSEGKLSSPVTEFSQVSDVQPTDTNQY
jgi:hypothetical protein